jgi:hypothetical protein
LPRAEPATVIHLTVHQLELCDLPFRHREGVLRGLVEQIRERDGNHLTTGFMGTAALQNVLSGRLADVMYDIASQPSFPSWGEVRLPCHGQANPVLTVDDQPIWKERRQTGGHPRIQDMRHEDDHLILIVNGGIHRFHLFAGHRPPSRPAVSIL